MGFKKIKKGCDLEDGDLVYLKRQGTKGYIIEDGEWEATWCYDTEKWVFYTSHHETPFREMHGEPTHFELIKRE